MAPIKGTLPVFFMILVLSLLGLLQAQEMNLVFYSGRTGNNEIFRMDFNGGACVQLTSDPARDGWVSAGPAYTSITKEMPVNYKSKVYSNPVTDCHTILAEVSFYNDVVELPPSV